MAIIEQAVNIQMHDIFPERPQKNIDKVKPVKQGGRDDFGVFDV
jgi:hypothetical protein